MSDLHILVVEDNSNWRNALEDYLQRLGESVHIDKVSNYIGASNFINRERYDLIIVDLKLDEGFPNSEDLDQQGMDLLRIARHSPYNKDCGLIVLTAHGSVPRVKQALQEYEVNDFVEKNQFNAQHFVDTVRGAIRNARLNKAKAKARTRWRLTITFNQEYLVESELTGPSQHAFYPATSRRRFKAAELIRHADKLNVLVLTEDANLWRPELRSLGKAIHNALFKEQCFQTGLITARAVAEHPSDLWLQFRGPAKDLGLPFELLYSGDDYLSRTHMLTRQLIPSGNALLHKNEPFYTFLAGILNAKEALRILIVGANNDSTIPAAEAEATFLKTTIESELQRLNITHSVDMLLGINASYDKVSEALRYGRYHIFHYAGHGLYDETLPEISGLVLHKNDDLRILTAANLHALVRDSELRLVFLSCCLGARNTSHIGRGDFYGMLEAIARAGVPMVLGYRWTVLDSSAKSLAEAFYDTLWHTFSPEEALLEARIKSTLGPRGLDDETWASPVLIMQNG